MKDTKYPLVFSFAYFSFSQKRKVSCIWFYIQYNIHQVNYTGENMFAFLRGVVAAKTRDQVHLDVNGVGYEIFVSDPVHRRVAPEQTTTLLTYCHIREDSFQIFGFLREEEKSLFLMLLSITGIGPKVALSFLSALTPAQFGQAIMNSDVTAITKVPGVGKKTAQRVVLEFKAKMGQDAELSAILGEDIDLDDASSDDVQAALMSLGCTPQEAKKGAAKARKELGKKATDEELVKSALRSMSKV
jgi:holliday junction DNA helicase RuvA